MIVGGITDADGIGPRPWNMHLDSRTPIRIGLVGLGDKAPAGIAGMVHLNLGSADDFSVLGLILLLDDHAGGGVRLRRFGGCQRALLGLQLGLCGVHRRLAVGVLHGGMRGAQRRLIGLPGFSRIIRFLQILARSDLVVEVGFIHQLP